MAQQRRTPSRREANRVVAKKTAISEEEENRLQTIYYDPSNPAALSSLAVLAAAANVSVKKTRQWLAQQSTYTLH